MSFDIRLVSKAPAMRAWIEFDPEYAWAVRRFEVLMNPDNDVKRSGSVEYSGMNDGRPIVKRVVDSNPMDYRVVEITEIKFDQKLNAGDFTLSAYGLPEVNQKPGDGRAIPLNYWLFGFGAIALVLAIIIRLALRKRTASSSSNVV